MIFAFKMNYVVKCDEVNIENITNLKYGWGHLGKIVRNSELESAILDKTNQ